MKDLAQLGGDGGAHGDLWDIGHGVLKEVKLAALPRDASKTGLEGGAQSVMVIADDEGDAVKPAFLKRGEEGSPVDFCLAQGGANAEDRAFAIGSHTNGQKHGGIKDDPIATHLFVSGVEDEVRLGDVAKRAVAPGFELLIECSRSSTDLGAGDFQSAGEFFEDGIDLSRGNALDVHLRNRQR